jgi:hypothetical protein
VTQNSVQHYPGSSTELSRCPDLQPRVAIPLVILSRSRYIDSCDFRYLFDMGDNVVDVATGSMDSTIYRAAGHHLPVEARNLLVQGMSCFEPIVQSS